MMTTNEKPFLKQAKEFIPQVRAEVKKVTWPTRRETVITSLFVFVFALIAAIYFSIVDWGVYNMISFVLGLGK